MGRKRTKIQRSQKGIVDTIPSGILLRHILQGHSGIISRIAWSPDGRMLASSSQDRTIRLWDAQTGQPLHTFRDHADAVLSVAWSPDGRMLASSSADRTIRLWNVKTEQLLHILLGHSGTVSMVIWSSNGEVVTSCSEDLSIRFWNTKTGQMIRTIEGHTSIVTSISFSCDEHLLASKSWDGSVQLWGKDTWKAVATLVETTSNTWTAGLTFHPFAPVLATLGKEDTVIRLWDLDVAKLLSSDESTSTIHYTSAKIALVGDSSVGKTGLGYRIAEGLFTVTESTHGQQFWVVDKLGKTREDGTQCEAVLWDFAGQPNFRPIHALFLNDVDLALVLFDPARPDTLTGVDYWLRQLAHKGQLGRTVLVAARTDVSGLSFSLPELEDFCRKRQISGGFIATSAKTNQGIDALLEIIRQQIDWNAKPATITTETFKRIKDYLLALKADPYRTNVLVSQADLRIQLQATDPAWHFSDAELLTAVGHLQTGSPAGLLM